jgi:hypothetical protein
VPVGGCVELGVKLRAAIASFETAAEYGLEYADLTASKTFLERHANNPVRPMAWPVRFEWDDHTWSESPSHRPNEQRTDPSTVHRDGNLASGES